MRIHVRMFGALAERAGRDRADLDLPPGSTAAEVMRLVGERHPQARPVLERISVAVNHEVVPADRPVAAGDEVALLPPVAGGARVLVGLRAGPTVEEALEAVRAPGAGGTVAFVGSVRDAEGSVERLEYSAYPEMAERVFRDIAEEASGKWPLAGVAILHGVGDLAVGEVTVVAACSSAHRAEAFEACRYVIDEVKERAPIWKKERGPGVERWVGMDP